MMFRDRKQATDTARSPLETMTRVEHIKGLLARGVVWLLILTTPLIGVGAWVKASTRPEPAAAQVASDDPDRLAAAAAAEQMIMSWLATTKDDPDKSLLASGEQLPTDPVTASDPAAVAVEQHGPGVWTVKVAVNVQGQRRFFQIPLRIDADSATALAGPTQVAGPTLQADRATLSKSLPSNDALSVAAAGFLSSLLTGEGDLARYTSPTVGIRPIIPAPYQQITIDGVWTSHSATSTVDGSTSTVQVRLRGSLSESMFVRLEYLLELTSRAGRWEVSQILPTPPQLDPVPTADPSNP